MSLIRLLLLMAATTTLASFTFAQGGFRIDVEPLPGQSSSFRSASNWSFRLQQRDLLMVWSCSPFVHSQDPKILTDAAMTANVITKQGPVSVGPMTATSTTAVSAGKDLALFDMHVQGTGKVDVRIDVTIDGESAAAGEHVATVKLTVGGL
jgi:hypothetical protein